MKNMNIIIKKKLQIHNLIFSNKRTFSLNTSKNLIEFNPEPELYRFIDKYINNEENKQFLASELIKKENIIKDISPLSLLNTFKGFYEYSSQVKIVHDFIFNNITEGVINNKSIGTISEYYFKIGGKMIRPHFIIQLSKYIYECKHSHITNLNNDIYFSSDIFINKIIPLSASIESLHNASLLQDDIIDNSETRRGYKTCHMLYGVKPTIFASNYILSKSSKAILNIGIPQLNEIYSSIIYDLTYGEYQQTINRSNEYSTNKEDIKKLLQTYIIKTYFKTASLISSSFRAVGLIYELSDENQYKLFKLGLHLGQLFQLVDDIFDVEGSSSQLKKPAFKDLNEGVINSHILFELQGQNGNEMIELINRKFQGKEDIPRVLKILDQGLGLLKTKNLAMDHLLEIFNILDDSFFKKTETKEKIIQGMIYMFNRKY